MSSTPSSRTRKLGRESLFELPRGDVFEVSAYMSSRPRRLPKKPVVICPNEVEEAEGLGHEELDETMSVPDVAPRRVAVPETPTAKDREGHEQTHQPTHSACPSQRSRRAATSQTRRTACSGKGGGSHGNGSVRLCLCVVGRCGRTTGEDAYDTGYQHGRWHSVCDRRQRCKGQVRHLFGGVVLERTGVHTISMQDGSRASDQRTRGCGHQVFGRRSRSGAGPQWRRFPRVTPVWVSWRAGTVSCSTVGKASDRRRCHSSVRAVVFRHASWWLNRFQRKPNGATSFENVKRVTHRKPLLQFGERCQWLEAGRIAHKYDPWWGAGVWLGDTLSQTRTSLGLLEASYRPERRGDSRASNGGVF